jgi:hypothetical protein
MTHFLFISRTIEADSGTQVEVQAHSHQQISYLIALNVAFPGTQNNHTLLLLERSCSDNKHWYRTLDEIVYEDRANNAALLSEHIQIVGACRKYSEQVRIVYISV